MTTDRWVIVAVCAGFAGFAVAVGWLVATDPSPALANEPLWMREHGSIVYLTRADYYRINGLIVGGWLVGAWTGVIDTVMERRAQRRTRHPKLPIV